MKTLVEELCSPRCAGRAPGTAEGAAARVAIIESLRTAGLDPFEQPIPGCGGANVLAQLRGDIDRWVVVAAHHDHLGKAGRNVYWGADDNAAAVAILVEVARGLVARRPHGRGVILATFDSEEPPYFMTDAMGSEHFARHPIVPLSHIDMMICMDLVGHTFGGDALTDEVSQSLFVLGAERSAGTSARIGALSRVEPGVIIRRIDAEAIPPLSDYHAFWTRSIPFLFLTGGRSRRYHTPEDVPSALAWNKMQATARWLERVVRENCALPEAPMRFLPNARDDTSTLHTLNELLTAVTPTVPAVAAYSASITELIRSCDAQGKLPDRLHLRASLILAALEAALQ